MLFLRKSPSIGEEGVSKQPDRRRRSTARLLAKAPRLYLQHLHLRQRERPAQATAAGINRG